jgi:predicted RNA methylase
MVKRATIKRIEIGEGNYMEVVRHWHGRREEWQWIVVLAEREDRSTFDELCIAAHKLGGYYQRAYAPANSPGGFAFDSEEQAEKFVMLQSKDIFEMSCLERIVTRREAVRQNAITHFTGLSGRMEERATDELHRERKENTERRIMQAENARDKAHDQLAMAGTLRSYAVALQERITRHTDRIRWRTHAEAFERLLARAGYRMSQVEYPWPVVGKHTLSEVAKQIGERDGSILITNRIKKLCRETEGESVVFVGSYADTLRDFYRRARVHRVKGWALDSIREALGDFKRCRLNNLDTLPELRAALREHQGIRVARTELTKAEKVMQDLYAGQFPPDYFPTPPDVAAIMLDYADIQPGMTWLEPECGAAHLANAIHERHPDTDGRLIELSGLLVNACRAQDWSPLHTDFLSFGDWQEAFDRVIANPPFGSDGLGTDIDHVRQMYTKLKPLGRIVTAMSDGVFYRGDAKAQEFRAWLDEEIAEDTPRGFSVELPEGAFLNSDRPTSWAARVVVIERGA